LSIEEPLVFDAMLAWGKSEAKKQNLSDKGVDLKKVMGEIIPHIRFLSMEVQSIATKVNPVGILEPQEMLDLFTYLGMKNSGVKAPKVPDSLKRFSAKPRVPRKKPDNFVFSTQFKHGSVTLSEKDLTATAGSSNQSVAADIVWEKGVHEMEWEVKGPSSAYAMVGFVPSSYTNYSAGSHIGDSTFNGWALFLYSTWSVYRNGSSTALSSGQSGTGPVIVGCRLDLDKRSCEFFRGGMKGTSIGTVFTDITGPVRPAITLFTGTVSIRPL